MAGYIGNIEEITLSNTNFRSVLFTGKCCQLVVMSLLPGEEIGIEAHPDVDQFFRIEKGEAKIVMNGQDNILRDGDAAIVPAGTEHNLINNSIAEPLKLYTIYSPPNHPQGTIHKTKTEAMAEGY